MELSDHEEEDDASADDLAHQGAAPISTAASVLFIRGRSLGSCELPLLSVQARARLIQIYHYRVDKVYKILHFSTALALIEANHTSPSESPPSSSVQLLEYSIYLMALCTMTDHECEALNLGDKVVLLQTYQSAVEDLLTQSPLLQNPDLLTLQAFVIYLVSESLDG